MDLIAYGVGLALTATALLVAGVAGQDVTHGLRFQGRVTFTCACVLALAGLSVWGMA